MTTFLVFDDKVGDPIADVLIKRPIDDIEMVELSKFLLRFGVANDGPCRLIVSPDSIRPKSVIDRVIEISPATIEAVGGAGTPLQRGQVYAAYEELISGAMELSCDRQYTSLGKLVPLPTQWLLVRQRLPQVDVPAFVYGYGPETTDTTGFDQPIFKSPFDLYGWKPNKRPTGLIWDELVVDRPTGRPLLSYQLGGELVVEAFDGESVSARLTESITTLFPIVLDVFAARVGEALWFVGDGSITFAAFSHFLAGAARSRRFEGIAHTYLLQSLAILGTPRLGQI